MWAAYCLLFYQQLFEDLINERAQAAVELVSVSTLRVLRFLEFVLHVQVLVSFGYLLHDFIDLVVNEQSARIIELLFHHVVVITGFVVTLVSSVFTLA